MGETIIRAARREDSAEIARLFLVSSDGLAAYIWGQMDPSGRPLIEIGAERYAREGVVFSYQNCLVAAQDGAVVGMLHAFPMEAPPPNAAPEPDPVLRPYGELEDYGSLYISGIALDPACRGQGLGTRLLAAAEARARALGLARLSLICFERNEQAMRLYARLGYTEATRRPLVPHPTLKYRDGDAVLLVRQLGSDSI
jgi:ribosomal protein S18 acetylase RimI-like enzyme